MFHFKIYFKMIRSLNDFFGCLFLDNKHLSLIKLYFFYHLEGSG